MLSVFILENNFFKQSFLESTIQEVFRKNSWKIRSLKIFGKPEKLLSHISERGSHQIFFLNLKITNDVFKGLEFAQKIRSLDPYAIIIIINIHQNILPLIFQYKIAALDVINEDINDHKFFEHIDSLFETCIARLGTSIHQDAISIKNSLSVFQIPFKNILFFETSDIVHKIKLHTITEKIEFYSSLKQIEKVDKRLFRCHKSFIINPQNVKQIDKTNNLVIFDNGENCFISKLKIKDLTKKFDDFRKIVKE